MTDILTRNVKIACLEKNNEENMAIHWEIKANIAWIFCGLDFIHVLFAHNGFARSY